MLAVVKRVNVYKTELPKHLYFSLRNWGEVKFEGGEMKVDHAGKEPKNSFLHADKKNAFHHIYFRTRWFLIPAPHFISGAVALDPALPQETIGIISNRAERKWNFK